MVWSHPDHMHRSAYGSVALDEAYRFGFAADDLLPLMSGILGLVQLKTPKELSMKRAKSMAQTLGEHLCANSTLPARSQHMLDIPVLLTDGKRGYLASTAEHNGDRVLFSSFSGGIASAACLMKHLLGASLKAMQDDYHFPAGVALLMQNGFSQGQHLAGRDMARYTVAQSQSRALYRGITCCNAGWIPFRQSCARLT